MVIVKNTFKASHFDSEYHLLHSMDTPISSDDENVQQRHSISAAESDDDDDEFNDCDSGAGSDDFDLLELGESGEEFCQVGDQTCSIPYELYDLPGLKDVLSMEVWNDLLTEGERFSLASYLPDMDQENFVLTLKELFAGDNLHFGSPVDKLFEMLKGGLCEPRVALYRQGLNFFQRRQHYHNLRNHQNAMVVNLCQIRDAWLNYRGYSIEEKLRVLNIMKSQKSLMNENMEEFGGESSDREESADDLWGTKAKDRKLGMKTGRYMGPASNPSSRVRKTTTEPTKHGKQKTGGTLKLDKLKILPMEEFADHHPPTKKRVEIKSVSHYKAVRDGSSAAVRMNEQIMKDDDETIYEIAVQRDNNFPPVGANKIPGPSKFWKKHGSARTELDVDSFMETPVSARKDLHVLGRNKVINQLSDIKVLTSNPSTARDMYGGGKRTKHAENLQQFTAENQVKFGKGRKSNFSMKGSEIELVEGSDPTWLSKQRGGLFPTDLPYEPSDFYAKSKNRKLGKEPIELTENDKLLHADYRDKFLKDVFQESSLQSVRRDGAGIRGMTFARTEETESDSSEQADEDEDDNNPLMRSKWAYPGNVTDLKNEPHPKKAKLSVRDGNESHLTRDGPSESSRKIEGHSGLELMKAELKGKMHDVGYMNILPSKALGNIYLPGLDNRISSDDQQRLYAMRQNGHVEGNYGENFHIPMVQSSIMERRLKGDLRGKFLVPQSNYMHEYEFQDDLFKARQLAADNTIPFKLGMSGQMIEQFAGYHPERSDAPFMGSNNLSKKRKMKHNLAYSGIGDNNDYLNVGARVQLDDISPLRKHEGNKLEDVSDALEKGLSGPPIMEVEMVDIEAETKPQKMAFPLITPTVHSGFSFSIIHLLSAVRVAMITLLPEDLSECGKHLDKNDAGKGVKEEGQSLGEDANVGNSGSNMDVNTSTPSAQANVPSLTVQEIVNRVRSNPGDPCILETQEPLQDLVRGVLKIFSSRTAPLGAKGWKPLAVHEKTSKCWSWIGPVSNNSSENEAVEEVTSPDSWGLPHKMLVKLVDSFANWLKNSQDALQQIGSLPSPPSTLMQNNLDEKERFKDMRAQKSLSTITPSSDEVKAYFRKEEVLRYLIPDRAFSYTAVDGKKSIVAPLRRCGGKPTSKARDHFMLKRDRPPHVTILCLVRDAAARLPGSIGTRADVCTLIRDSQYIVEDVSDAQVNQVVSGALDRLHYERDPCVQFDGERKLWVYLHREREEEDFEDDGTSSTKKWRRQKKEATEPSEHGDATPGYVEPLGESGFEPSEHGDATPGYVEPLGESGFDLASDLNESTFADNDKRSEPDYHNDDDKVEDNAETSHGSNQENKLLCEENSANEDYNEDTFGDEPPS